MFGIRETEISPINPPAFVTLADVKEYLGISDANSDTKLTALIATASAQIEAYCGTIIAERTVTERIVPEDRLSVLALSHCPISAFTSVTIDDTLQTLSDFRWNRSGTIRRKDGSLIESLGEIVVVYLAGYAAGSYPAEIVQATKDLVKFTFSASGRDYNVKRESLQDVGSVEYVDGAGNMYHGQNGIAVPADVANCLAPHIRRFAL